MSTYDSIHEIVQQRYGDQRWKTCVTERAGVGINSKAVLLYTYAVFVRPYRS